MFHNIMNGTNTIASIAISNDEFSENAVRSNNKK